MPNWSRFEGREDIIGVRDTPEGREFLMHNEALCNPYYTAMEAKMESNELTPEVLDRLEKAARYATAANQNDYDWPCTEMLRLPPFYAMRCFLAEANPATILALLRAYRKLESENSKLRSPVTFYPNDFCVCGHHEMNHASYEGMSRACNQTGCNCRDFAAAQCHACGFIMTSDGWRKCPKCYVRLAEARAKENADVK